MITRHARWQTMWQRVVIALLASATLTFGARAVLRRDITVTEKHHPNGRLAERRE